MAATIASDSTELLFGEIFVELGRCKFLEAVVCFILSCNQFVVQVFQVSLVKCKYSIVAAYH